MTGTRIDGLPVLVARTDQIDAALYNLWRRARRRLGCPLHLELPGLPAMHLILEDACWVVVDHNQNDLPVLAWTAFQDEGRDSLHTPVACTLNFYHFMASHLRGKVLARMAELLAQRLQ